MTNYVDILRQRAKANDWVAPPNDTIRIVRLPRAAPTDVDMTPYVALPHGTMKLFPLQSEALYAIHLYKGLLGIIGVGHGKSLIALLAGTILGSKRAVILAPASTISQMHRTMAEARGHFAMTETRILSYDILSRPEGSRLLEDSLRGIAPSELVLVADEAHKVKRKESARTMRVLRFVARHPQVRFVALSGTMTSKSIKDFAHLADMALRERSPVPQDKHHLRAWSECLDVGGKPNPSDWTTIAPLWEAEYPSTSVHQAAGASRLGLIRRAFQSRLRSAPGVVASTEGSLGTSLRIRALDLEVPQAVQDALAGVEADGILPDGEVLEDDLAVWRARRQISQGFYYVWDWPDGVVDEEWLTARRTWFGFVRKELKDGAREGYDSPALVEREVAHRYSMGCAGRMFSTGQPVSPIEYALVDWQRVKDRPAPPTKPVWIERPEVHNDRFFVDRVVEQARSLLAPVIIWYEDQAVADELDKHVKVYRRGETPNINEAPVCAAGIQAHGTGLDLQAWSNMVVLCPPAGGYAWEQLLGRLHRVGQDADEVTCWTYQHTRPFVEAVIKACGDAEYIQYSTGNVQKLKIADYEGFSRL